MQADEFSDIKTSPDIQRTRCVTEKNHVAHPRSRIKKYLGRAIKNPPFEGESEEVERPRKKKETIGRRKIFRRPLRDRGSIFTRWRDTAKTVNVSHLDFCTVVLQDDETQ